jgi:diacylglycerol O-acyltransferase / trehalose O-mycolyltransferase
MLGDSPGEVVSMGALPMRMLVTLAVGILVAACGAGGASPSSSVPSTGSTPSGSLPPSTPSAIATRVPTPSPATIGQAADDGARIIKVTTVDRMRDLTIDSPAVGIVQVRLLVPDQFDAEPAAKWPVFYLLHGATGSHSDWTQFTDVEALTAPTDLLVVMPDAGDFGFYSDWWNGGHGGVPMWETFHLVELRQLLERNWRASEKRVVAGLSMGGYGAMEYAARKPGMFLAAASYSGALDPIGSKLDIGTEDIWGDPVSQADIWEAHDPVNIAAKLKGTALYVSYGDGGQGPLDQGPVSPDDLEGWIADQNKTFVARLAKLKIPLTLDAYGPGSHDWPYWERALHRSLPLLLKALGE